MLQRRTQTANEKLRIARAKMLKSSLGIVRTPIFFLLQTTF
jgi:hypothetical protein